MTIVDIEAIAAKATCSAADFLESLWIFLCDKRNGRKLKSFKDDVFEIVKTKTGARIMGLRPYQSINKITIQ